MNDFESMILNNNLKTLDSHQVTEPGYCVYSVSSYFQIFSKEKM